MSFLMISTFRVQFEFRTTAYLDMQRLSDVAGAARAGSRFAELYFHKQQLYVNCERRKQKQQLRDN